MKKWFVTWSRLEYKEWAIKSKNGYLLVIVRKEKTKYLCVKAELLIGEKGLPGFNVLEEARYAFLEKANEQIREWMKFRSSIELRELQ